MRLPRPRIEPLPSEEWSDEQRELLTRGNPSRVRVGHLCRSGYEFHQHTRIGKAVGLDDAAIERIKSGPDAHGWSAREAALLRAVDELHADQFIGDATWQVSR
jgi:hypothetical protein